MIKNIESAKVLVKSLRKQWPWLGLDHKAHVLGHGVSLDNKCQVLGNWHMILKSVLVNISANFPPKTVLPPFLRRCMECRRRLAMRILSVCPSVRPSVTRVNCNKTVERSV